MGSVSRTFTHTESSGVDLILMDIRLLCGQGQGREREGRDGGREKGPRRSGPGSCTIHR